MYTLVCSGIFCDNLTLTTTAVMSDNYFALALIFIFMVVALLTVLNMLVGILCTVVDEESEKEKNVLRAALMTEKLKSLIRSFDENSDGKISKAEFLKVLEIPEASRFLHALDIDAVVLVDIADFLFEEKSGLEDGMLFDDFIDILMKLRNTNQATVRDLVQLHRNLVDRLSRLEAKVDMLEIVEQPTLLCPCCHSRLLSQQGAKQGLAVDLS